MEFEVGDAPRCNPPAWKSISMRFSTPSKWGQGSTLLSVLLFMVTSCEAMATGASKAGVVAASLARSRKTVVHALDAFESNPVSARGLSGRSCSKLRAPGMGNGRSVHRSGVSRSHFRGQVVRRATHVCDGGCSLVSYVSPGAEIGNVLKGRPGGLYCDVGVDGMEIVTIVTTVALNGL